MNQSDERHFNREGNGHQSGPERRQTSERAGAEASHTEQLAQRLRREASQPWQKAVEGALAIPSAIALGLAANTLYIAAFIQRGLEVFQLSAESVRQSAYEVKQNRDKSHEQEG
jgi:hypothetical protein